MSVLSQFINVTQPSSNITLNPLCVNRITICQYGLVQFDKCIQGPNEVGCYFEGGHVICKAASVSWIVSPRQSQVLRTWDCREDANTLASLCSSCTGWFVPTITQLQNPGYTCRTFWDSFSSAFYWSSTEFNATRACCVSFSTGNASTDGKATTLRVRAFRCVTY